FLFYMGREARLDRQHRAAVETDHPDRQIFDRVGLVIPVWPLTGHIAWLVADIGERVAGGTNGPGRTHHVMSHLQQMHSQVNQRAAALQFLSPKHAPVGNSAASKPLAARIQDVSELAFRYLPAD